MIAEDVPFPSLVHLLQHLSRRQLNSQPNPKDVVRGIRQEVCKW